MTWYELVRVAMADAGGELDRRFRLTRHAIDPEELDDIDLPATPRIACRPDSMQRTGNRIRKALGKLSYHWHQDGHGARWSSACS